MSEEMSQEEVKILMRGGHVPKKYPPKRASADHGTMRCELCNADCQKTGPVQKYCEPCSEKRDRERKREWLRNNPLTEAQRQANAALQVQNDAGSRALGIQRSVESSRSITWQPTGDIDASWLLRIAVPFSYAASKNHIYAMGHRGHRYLRGESTAFRDSIILRVKEALNNREVFQAKLWIDILVQKTNHRGDAINVIDLVCDGLKSAVGIDDRWFCIRRLDWEIVKQSPQIFIGLTQEATEHQQVCSYCGRVLPLDAFYKSKHGRVGVGRECKECLKGGRRERKK